LLTPGRWRAGLRLNEAIPWVRATVCSGFLESLLAFFARIDWYSRSVTTWAANAFDSALRNGPERAVPGQAIGFSALVLWVIHPLTWLIGFFVIEGLRAGRWKVTRYTRRACGRNFDRLFRL
jgi:hypothetical protein